MFHEIIKKLNLTRAEGCFHEPWQYLTKYHYKNDIYMGGGVPGFPDTVLVYKEGIDEYSLISDVFFIDTSIEEIEKGLNKKYIPAF